MNLIDFINEAFDRPTDLIAYEVSRRLERLFPGHVVLEGTIYSFDLDAFAMSRQCEIVENLCLHNKSRVELSETGKSLKRFSENAWYNVLWRGNLLDVLVLTWTEEGYRTRHHFVIAETRAIAEEFVRSVCAFGSEVRGEILVFDRGYWHKNEELFEAIKSASFDNVLLPSELKKDLREDVARFFNSRDLYEDHGIPWKRGVLLIGPPGNGKTQTVKALANESAKPCLYVKSFRGCWGTDHDRIRDVFKQARNSAPCIVVMEDLDSLIDNGNRSFFLNELDGFTANPGVLVLATTNYPDRLDPAILERPSRFDRKYYLELPTIAGRIAYLRRWRDSVRADLRFSDETMWRLGRETEGFSFAYLKELCVSAMMAWMSGNGAPMDGVILRLAALLRKQMTDRDHSKKAKKRNKRMRKRARAAVTGCELWS